MVIEHQHKHNFIYIKISLSCTRRYYYFLHVQKGRPNSKASNLIDLLQKFNLPPNLKPSSRPKGGGLDDCRALLCTAAAISVKFIKFYMWK